MPKVGRTLAISKGPCQDCGSSDGVETYEDHTHCYVCDKQHWFKGPPQGAFDSLPPRVTRLEMSGAVMAIKDRGISKATCVKFGVTAQQGVDGNIVNHWYPYYNIETKELTATKKRICATKDFPWSGDRSGTGLFGQQTCKGRGKFLTITEGELDALAVSEMFDNKWDVVSLRDGSKSAARDIKAQLEWLEGYDQIVLCFDEDEQGRAAVAAIQDLFSPNKVKVVSLALKDADAMLVAGRVKEFIGSWWDAKTYMPAGIVKADETWQAVLDYRDTPSIAYPWGGLNDILLGQRLGEVVIWAAETGVGKSQTMRELIHHVITSTEQQVGCLMLEESVAKSMLGWMSFHAGRPLHKELAKIPDEELRKYWEKASAGNRFVLLDHRGWQNDIDQLKGRIRYMAKALGCRTIILDHLHIALSSVSGATGDWSGIDELVTQLCVLAQECNICLHVVSHVTGERALRGSKGISKLVDAVVFLERDRHNEDVDIANTTQVVVDKNRFAGDVGTACYLKYDRDTGRMTECDKPDNLVESDDF